MPWEDDLGSFADGSESTYARTSVVDPSSSWVGTWYVGKGSGQPANADIVITYDVTNNGSANVDDIFVIALAINWANITGPSAPNYQWAMQGDTILNPLVHMPQQNAATSMWSFDNASAAVSGVDTWLSGWQAAIKAWADEVDAPDSDWQGSAAGVFKGLLTGIAGQLETLRINMRTSDVVGQLKNAHDQLGGTLQSLYNSYVAWRASRYAQVHLAVMDQFATMISRTIGTWTATNTTTYGANNITYNVSFSSPWGDPATQAYWDALDKGAKGLWTQNVVSGLDTPSDPLITQLGSTYQQVSATLATGVSLPALRTPPPVDPGNTDPVDPNATTDGLLNNLLNGKGQGTGGDPTGTNPAGGDTTPFGIKNSSPVGGPAGGGNLPSNPSIKSVAGIGGGLSAGGLSAGGLGGGGLGGGGLGGGEQQLLDANGNPILDNGKPVMAPPGAFIGAGGVLMNASGQPLEPNGHKIVAPKGATLSGTGLSSDPLLTVPKGAKINPDGTVVDAQGNPVLSNGSPMVVPKGSTISSKGVIEGPNGQALTESTARELSAGNFQPNLNSPDLISPNGINDVFPGGVKFAGGLNDLKMPAGGSTVSDANGMPLQRTMAMSDRMAAATGTPAEDLIPRTPTMSEAVPAETALGRPGTSSDQPPFMPPMGGAGGGGGGGGQEKRPNTWLTEDEKVWGTEHSGATGGIGR